MFRFPRSTFRVSHSPHPTSSSIPNRSRSCRSPRSHTHPFPPLQTNWPDRRSRPGSISLISRSNGNRPPTCARCPPPPPPPPRPPLPPPPPTPPPAPPPPPLTPPRAPSDPPPA